MQISQWLASVNPYLEQYAEALVNYGYEETSLLKGATTGDIEAVMEEVRMKKGHRRTFTNAAAALSLAATVPSQFSS
jgi:hypothetical protein